MCSHISNNGERTWLVRVWKGWGEITVGNVEPEMDMTGPSWEKLEAGEKNGHIKSAQCRVHGMGVLLCGS